MKLLNGKEYSLLYNLYALDKLEEAFGDIENLGNVFEGGKKIHNVIKFLQIGINARIKYENIVNSEDDKLYDFDTLSNLIDMTNFADLVNEIVLSYTDSQKPQVETESKNM